VGDRVSTHEVDKANEVHVIDYMYAKGEPIQKIGNNYYRHTEHDSLVFHTNGKWYWNSHNTGGFGAISLARELYGMKFQDAVRDVNGQTISKTVEHDISNNNKEFIYPHHYETKTLDNAINYLSNVRSIDPKIILALKKHDLIAEDKLKNIVFKWRDKDGNIVGADKQGTQKIESKRGYFKQIMAESKADGGFTLDIGKPNKIAFFESPIDLLSYYDIKRPTNIRLLSMSGLKDQTLIKGVQQLAREMKERGNVSDKKEKLEVIIAVDNDSAGETFRKNWKDIISEENLKIDIPTLKDWNDDLRKMREHEKLNEHHKQSNFSSNKIVEIER